MSGTTKFGKRRKRIPESVNSEENSRVKTGMLNDLSFTHPQSLRHPVQESEVSPKIEIDQLAHKIRRAPWAGSSSTDVPFREIDPVVDGLNPEESKGQQEGKCTKYVDGSRDPYVFKSGHWTPRVQRGMERERMEMKMGMEKQRNSRCRGERIT